MSKDRKVNPVTQIVSVKTAGVMPVTAKRTTCGLLTIADAFFNDCGGRFFLVLLMSWYIFTPPVEARSIYHPFTSLGEHAKRIRQEKLRDFPFVIRQVIVECHLELHIRVF